MIELRKVIVNEIEKHHDRVYYHHAPNDKRFPYIVYNFPNSYMNEDQEIFNMDLDVWDNSESSLIVEQLASDLWRAFNKYKYIDKDIQFSINRANRLPPLDENETDLKRRKLIFELRYFDRRI